MENVVHLEEVKMRNEWAALRAEKLGKCLAKRWQSRYASFGRFVDQALRRRKMGSWSVDALPPEIWDLLKTDFHPSHVDETVNNAELLKVMVSEFHLEIEFQLTVVESCIWAQFGNGYRSEESRMSLRPVIAACAETARIEGEGVLP